MLNTQKSRIIDTSISSNNVCLCTKPQNCPTEGIINHSFCGKYADYLKAITYFNDVVPKIFIDVSFSNFVSNSDILKIALKKSRYFVENRLWQKGNGIIMHGGYGTGKTRLGYTILKEIAIMGGIIGVIDVLRDLETFESADKAIKRTMKSDIIFIDDLGAKDYKWVEEKIRIVIDEVNRNQKSLIISTNLNPKELINSLEQRTSSRLIEIVPKQGIIYLGEEDYRIKKREEKEKAWQLNQSLI
ncbi:MAG TPA: ATP-binding protein [Defluviitoga sp.]|nr:ATP-binding protein [Defluviitoga sp.]